jgi:hypothetical protein
MVKTFKHSPEVRQAMAQLKREYRARKKTEQEPKDEN